jgi:hypothetical protein
MLHPASQVPTGAKSHLDQRKLGMFGSHFCSFESFPSFSFWSIDLESGIATAVFPQEKERNVRWDSPFSLKELTLFVSTSNIGMLALMLVELWLVAQHYTNNLLSWFQWSVTHNEVIYSNGLQLVGGTKASLALSSVSFFVIIVPSDPILSLPRFLTAILSGCLVTTAWGTHCEAASCAATQRISQHSFGTGRVITVKYFEDLFEIWAFLLWRSKWSTHVHQTKVYCVLL